MYGEREEQEHEQAQEQAVGTRVEQQGLVSEIEGEQRTTTKRTNNSGRKSNTQKKRMIRRDKLNNDFAKTFACIPTVQQERPRVDIGSTCSLGGECKNIQIKGTMKCHRNGCGNRILTIRLVQYSCCNHMEQIVCLKLFSEISIYYK